MTIATFKTTSAAPGNPITTINWGALGDIRLEGIYAGFFADLSAGVTFGVKAADRRLDLQQCLWRR